MNLDPDNSHSHRLADVPSTLHCENTSELDPNGDVSPFLLTIVTPPGSASSNNGADNEAKEPVWPFEDFPLAWPSNISTITDTSRYSGSELASPIDDFPIFACAKLLAHPRETWADNLDVLYDPDGVTRSDIVPATKKLMKVLCNAIADSRRGGTGLFKPELYRPGPDGWPAAWPTASLPGSSGPDQFDKGPDPDYDMPPADYLADSTGGTAIQKYHWNKQVWDGCDDLLNIAPSGWMTSFLGIAELIFLSPVLECPGNTLFTRATLDLLDRMRLAFGGQPPPGVGSGRQTSFPEVERLDMRQSVVPISRMS